MKTALHPGELKRLGRPVVLAAGYFDGLHRGHAAVINCAVRTAAEVGGETWCLTFDVHPMRVLDKAAAPMLLTSNRHRLLLMRRMGVDGCILLRFTRRMAATPPEAFVEMLLRGIPALVGICAGSDWRFGSGGAGDVRMLARIAESRGIRVTAVPPVLRRGRPVSSTSIREHIRAGRLSEAAALLGRPFSVLGTVRSGQALGRKLGFPTANVSPDNEALPPPGVYAVFALAAGRVYPGVANLGRRPTFVRAGGTVLEAHLVGFSGNLYRRSIEVFFLRRLRAERTFPTPGCLKRQIRLDIAAARKTFAAHKTNKTNCDSDSGEEAV
jgi:riboflavin kinase/FMN adenylyltransferase